MIFIRNQIRNKTQSLLSPYTAVNQRLITSPTHETTTMISCSLLFHNAKLFSAESREMSRAHKAAKRWEWQMGRTAGTESAVTSSSNLRPTPPPPLSHYLQFIFLNIKTHLHSLSYTRFSKTETQLEKNVGLGPCFHISGAVCAPNSWAAVSGSRAAPVCRVWEFSHQWCFYYGPFSPLLCSRLCLLDCC